ncbi:monocarboxylate transporter 1-like [Patiria miniata]|uniref:Monocarboxylate transporter n=1 Tax=Patiria miniata TaxID=46514 RepID=A0A913ZWP6_PATMI|nr:monocarboxylate transporter 1-like [Patiria miniata]
MAPSVSAAAHPYDRDKRGWVMVATAFTSNLVVFGNLKALGVLLFPMTNDLDSDLWLVGWILVFYGILHSFMGLGAAFSVFISTAVMASYFKEKYPLAVGLSTMGIPTGMMVYGPVTQVLLDIYGWRGTTLLLGAISFNLVVCAVLVKRDPSSSSSDTVQYHEVSVSDHENLEEGGRINAENKAESSDGITRSNHESHKSQANKARQCCRHIMEAIDFAVLTDVRFVLLICARCVSTFTYSSWLVYMVSHGQFQGLSEIQASFLPAAFGIGNVVGKLGVPLMQRAGILPPMTFWACFGASIVSASFLLDAFIKPFVGQLVLTGLVGVGFALNYQAIDVMVRFLSTDDRLISVLGWQGMFISVAGALGGLISGRIYELTGSFSSALFVFSGVSLLSIPLFVSEAIYARRKAH